MLFGGDVEERLRLGEVRQAKFPHPSCARESSGGERPCWVCDVVKADSRFVIIKRVNDKRVRVVWSRPSRPIPGNWPGKQLRDYNILETEWIEKFTEPSSSSG